MTTRPPGRGVDRARIRRAGCATTASTLAIAAAAGLQPAVHRQLRRPSATCACSWSRSSPVAIVALGMALVIGTEGIDLSVGSVMALAAALLPLYLGYGAVAADRWSALLAGAAGRRWSTARWSRSSASSRSSPRSACWSAGRGLALVLADGRLTRDLRPDPGRARQRLGRSASRSCVLIARRAGGASSAFVVRRAAFGRRLVAIGGNRPAADAGRPAGPAHPDHRLRHLRRARRARRRARHRPAGRQRPVVRRPAHRAQRDHRGGGRRHAADRRPGPDPRHPGRRAADAADRRDADPAQPAGLVGPDDPGGHHRRRGLRPARPGAA